MLIGMMILALTSIAAAQSGVPTCERRNAAFGFNSGEAFNAWFGIVVAPWFLMHRRNGDCTFGSAPETNA
jgi:purine-cytosine permease-like protein